MGPLDRLILLAGLLVALLPGAALLAALRIRSPLLFAALTPTATIGVLLAVASATGAVGLPFSPLTAGLVTAALLVVGVLRWWRGRASAMPVRQDPGAPRWTLRGRPWAPAAAGTLLVLAGGWFGTRTWLRGLGGLDRAPQEHDMITHQVVVAWIMRTGRAAPWQVEPVDLLTGSPVTFYPDGSHLAPALLGALGPGAVPGLNALTVVYLAVCWVISTAVLTAVAARRLRAGTGAAWLAAGVAGVVAPALYRPAFQLMHDGGIYATAVALALAPGLIAALLLSEREPRVRTAVALGVGAAGIVAAYPGAAVTVGLSTLAWLAGDLVARDGWARLRRSAPVLIGAGVVAGALSVPLVLRAGGSVSGVASFPPDSGPTAFGDALGSALGLGYGGFLDPQRTTGQLGLTVLYLAGVLIVFRARRGLGPVLAWAVWVSVVLAAFLSPGIGVEAHVTGFFYNAMLRVWSHVSLFVPTFAALAVVLVVTEAVRRTRRVFPRAVRAWPIASALVLVAGIALLAVPVRTAMNTNTRTVAERYATPDFTRVSPSDVGAVEFLRGRVAPGERVLNSANDGSTLLYVAAGIPVVNVSSLGTGSAPWTFGLMESFNRYPTDPAVRAELERLNVGWVYVDSDAPAIGASGAPFGWVDRSKPFSTAPGLTNLDGLPGLTLAYRDGTVSVYRLDLDRLAPPG
ncbi:MAG: hypothetical protein L0I76_06785 [Pseudonocardia sp.]|nr:hypothetical protein [Pseudonocardia sp.]